MDSDKQLQGYNIGFVDILTLIFITLKLLGKITWSWWWVLSPMLIKVAVILLILFIVGVLYIIKKCLD